MDNKQYDKGRTVTFKELWSILTQRFPAILAAGLAGVMLLFVAVQGTYTPRYESRATLYIMRQGDGTTYSDASSEFSLALKLVNDCTYFLKSHSVLDQVIEDLELDMTYEQLHNSVTAYNPDNTRILEIIVEADSPELAKQIVDQICQIAPHVIEEAMGSRQVQLFENGALNTEPCNQVGRLAYLLAFAVIAVAAYGVFLVAYLLDDRIRSDEDIERVLGLSVLGNIPDANSTQHDRYGYYAYKSKRNRGDRA